jgi:YidC/Oxa1 family membrane protein insertase
MDIRRTILLMIFSFSLLMLWNNWQVHQGNPPLFGAPTPTAKPKAETADAASLASSAGLQQVLQRKPSYLKPMCWH